VLVEPPSPDGVNILFLHHSTGQAIWDGGVENWFEKYRNENQKKYFIIDQPFPRVKGNYPQDYWNIWVNHQGENAFENDPTLEMITQKYDVVIWKHCYPLTDVLPDKGSPEVSSDYRSIENYKVQYNALKLKMLEFPETKFLIWTGAVKTKEATTEENAKRAHAFYLWVKNEWENPGDNIFLWDFYELETEGGIYLREEYAMGKLDSHPNSSFASQVSKYMCQRIVDVIEGRGDFSNITGK
jgi:hypothetical protein